MFKIPCKKILLVKPLWITFTSTGCEDKVASETRIAEYTIELKSWRWKVRFSQIFILTLPKVGFTVRTIWFKENRTVKIFKTFETVNYRFTLPRSTDFQMKSPIITAGKVCISQKVCWDIFGVCVDGIQYLNMWHSCRWHVLGQYALWRIVDNCFLLIRMPTSSWTQRNSIFLTLRGLSLFFEILPISNTGDSIAYILATVHLLYPKPGSFFDMDYYFYQHSYQDSKVPKRFVRLNEMQYSPSFD